MARKAKGKSNTVSITRAKKLDSAARKANGKRTNSPFNPDHKIHLLVKDNPKRPKSKEFKRFAQYRNGMTVAQAKALGMNTLNFARDVGLGFISIKA